MANACGLFVSVPVACFREPRAREYLESLDVPPPATVYGMLLSLVGEVDRRRHLGAEVAEALLSKPARSTVLRQVWRVKDEKVALGMGKNRRPDYQHLLTGVGLAVFVRTGTVENTTPSLAERVQSALEDPASVRRFGGLCLGESTHLVDEVRPLRDVDLEGTARLLIRAPDGTLALPVWVDHVGSAETEWVMFRLVDAPTLSLDPAEVSDDAWAVIGPSGDGNK